MTYLASDIYDPLGVRRVFESSDILPKIMATNNDKSLELQTLGTADDELEYHTDNDSEQENSDCEIIHQTVSDSMTPCPPTPWKRSNPSKVKKWQRNSMRIRNKR